MIPDHLKIIKIKYSRVEEEDIPCKVVCDGEFGFHEFVKDHNSRRIVYHTNPRKFFSGLCLALLTE